MKDFFIWLMGLERDEHLRLGYLQNTLQFHPNPLVFDVKYLNMLQFELACVIKAPKDKFTPTIT